MIRLVTICKSCQAEIRLKANEPSRMEIENKYGTIFELSCNHCQTKSKYHVNDVYSKVNKTLTTLGSIIVLTILALIILMSFGSIILMLFTFALIPVMMKIANSEALKKRIGAFNKAMVPRDRNYEPKNKKIF